MELLRGAPAVIGLFVVILAVASWQAWLMFNGDPWIGIDRGGMSGAALAHGMWWTPVTSMFMHAGIVHLLFNLAALFSLSLPIAYRFGNDRRGVLTFLGFYFLCGLSGDAVFLAIHPAGQTPVIGASGAIFGLWGAVARLGPDGAIVPIFSGQVGRQTWSAVLSNLIIVALFLVPALLSGGQSFGGIAWEAHLGGYLAGLLLIGLPTFRAHWRRP